MPNITRCKVCVFWEKLEEDFKTKRGLCRAYIPIASPEDFSGITVTRWPVTTATDGCGEGYKE